MKLNGGGTDQSGTSHVDHICEIEAINRIFNDLGLYGLSLFTSFFSVAFLNKYMGKNDIRSVFIDIRRHQMV